MLAGGPWPRRGGRAGAGAGKRHKADGVGWHLQREAAGLGRCRCRRLLRRTLWTHRSAGAAQLRVSGRRVQLLVHFLQLGQSLGSY